MAHAQFWEHGTMTRRRRFTGIVHFPSALPVGPDALGLAKTVIIGGHRVGLWLPQTDSETMQLNAPSMSEATPLADVLSRSLGSGWGYRSTSKLYYVNHAVASFLLTPTDVMATSEEFRALGDAALQWFEIVRDWAEAWSGIPLREVGRARDSVLSIPTGGGQMAETGTLLGPVFFGAQALTREQVRGAFQRATRNDHLPAEHRLIQSAQVARYEGDLRRAVIDAVSAAEVALGAAITRDMARRRDPSDFIELAIENANGVVGLIKLYSSLGHTPVVSKGKAADQLARVRNLAAHGGHVPTVEQVDVAIKLARDLVRDACPLPTS